MAENKSPESNYAGRSDIVLQDDTTLPPSGAILNAQTAATIATARAQHLTKMDAEATAKEARAALAYMGATVGTVKRAKA